VDSGFRRFTSTHAAPRATSVSRRSSGAAFRSNKPKRR
jgi:hypothetical protein